MRAAKDCQQMQNGLMLYWNNKHNKYRVNYTNNKTNTRKEHIIMVTVILTFSFLIVSKSGTEKTNFSFFQYPEEGIGDIYTEHVNLKP